MALSTTTALAHMIIISIDGVVAKSLTRMQDGEIVEELQVAGPQDDGELGIFGGEVEGVEGLGLGVGQVRYARGAGGDGRAGQLAAREAEEGPVRGVVEEEGPGLPHGGLFVSGVVVVSSFQRWKVMRVGGGGGGTTAGSLVKMPGCGRELVHDVGAGRGHLVVDGRA